MTTSYKRWEIDWNRRFDRELRRIDSQFSDRVNWDDATYYRVCGRLEPEDAAMQYAKTHKTGD